MAITRDQPSQLFGAGGTTATITWSVNPTAGAKVLVAFAFGGSATITSVKDNGTTQTTFSQDFGPGTATNHLYIFRGDGISLPSAGSYIVTVTFSAASGGCTAFGESYLGVATGGPTASNDSAATSTSVTTNSATPAAAGALFFAAFVDSSSANPETITLTGSGFTEQATQTNGATLDCAGFADKIDSGGPTSTACTWTLGDSVNWGAAIVTYDAVAAAAAPPVQVVPLRPGKTWRRRFRHKRLALQQFTRQVSDSDAGTGDDETLLLVEELQITGDGATVDPSLGETAQIALSDSDTGTGTDAGESITAALSDSDASNAGNDAGEKIALSDSDAGTGTDAGENVTVIGGITPDSAPPVIRAPGFYAPPSLGYGAEKPSWQQQVSDWTRVGVSDSDAGSGADAGEKIALSDSDASNAGNDAGEAITASVPGSDAGSASDAGIAIEMPIAPFIIRAPGFYAPPSLAHGIEMPSWQQMVGDLTTFGIFDSDSGHGIDAGESIAVTLSDSDTGHGTDAGEAIAAASSDSDAGSASDAGIVAEMPIAPFIIRAPGFYPPALSYGIEMPSWQQQVSDPSKTTSAPVSVNDSDSFTGTESDPVTIRIIPASQETAAGNDAGEAIAATLSDADTGTGNDVGAQIRLSSSDSETSTESDPATIKPSDIDSGSGSEGTPSAGISETDSFAASEAASFTELPLATLVVARPPGLQSPAAWRQPYRPFYDSSATGAIVITDGDTGHLEDLGTAFITTADTGSGADLESPLQLSAADTGLFTEAEFSKWPTSSDTGTGTETQYWSGPLSDSDAGTSTDSHKAFPFSDSDAVAGAEIDPAVIDVWPVLIHWIPPNFFSIAWHRGYPDEFELYRVTRLERRHLEDQDRLNHTFSLTLVTDSDAGTFSEANQPLANVEAAVLAVSFDADIVAPVPEVLVTDVGGLPADFDVVVTGPDIEVAVEEQ